MRKSKCIAALRNSAVKYLAELFLNILYVRKVFHRCILICNDLFAKRVTLGGNRINSRRKFVAFNSKSSNFLFQLFNLLL